MYPNADLPNAMGGCDEDHEVFSTNILDYAKDGWLDLVGGCCRNVPSRITVVMEKGEWLPAACTTRTAKLPLHAALRFRATLVEA